MKLEKHRNKTFLILNDKCSELDCHTNNEFYYLSDYLCERDNNRCGFDDIAKILPISFPDSVCISIIYDGRECEFLDYFDVARTSNSFLLRVFFSYMISDGEYGLHPLALSKVVVAETQKYIPVSKFKKPIVEDDFVFWDITVQANENQTIGDTIQKIASKVSRIHDEVLGRFALLLGVSTKLEVPEKYKFVFCQYLSYFGQFLRDIGVQSDTSVSTSANSIHLMIKPHDKDESVEKIYLALAGYLGIIRDSSIISLSSDSFSAQAKYNQLIANVEHLRRQVHFLEESLDEISEQIPAMFDTKNTILTTLNTSGTGLVKETSETWEVFEGLEIKQEIEWKCFKIKTRKIFHLLRRLLSVD